MNITKSLILVLVMLTGLTGCGVTVPSVPPQQANVASLDPQRWFIFFSAGMPDHPSADSQGAWSFEFPSAQAGGHVNYVQTPFNVSPTTILHNVNITFKVESVAPQYDVIDTSDILPATTHLFFMQKNDDLVSANGRWWAGLTGGYKLGSEDNSTITLIVPFTPDQWTNVYGQHDSNAFYAALDNIGWIGFTCGGRYFWGHGVALSSGSAKYILVDFHVD